MRITFGIRCKALEELDLDILAYGRLLAGSAGYD